jgi:hypothetical protein
MSGQAQKDELWRILRDAHEQSFDSSWPTTIASISGPKGWFALSL